MAGKKGADFAKLSKEIEKLRKSSSFILLEAGQNGAKKNDYIVVVPNQGKKGYFLFLQRGKQSAAFTNNPAKVLMENGYTNLKCIAQAADALKKKAKE